MASRTSSGGRRERNKQEKLQRIVAAARDLFAEHGAAEVTTQQIADRADVATGTLFLYARNKGELLLLVHNSTYAEALDRGRRAAQDQPVLLDAAMAIVSPIVECNREQPENGRSYLREVVFGDPAEPHHRDALLLTRQTEQAIATVLQRDPAVAEEEAALRARVVLSVMFLTMSSPLNADQPAGAVIEQIRSQLAVVLTEPVRSDG